MTRGKQPSIIRVFIHENKSGDITYKRGIRVQKKKQDIVGVISMMRKNIEMSEA
jgi:hypothetical protein